MNPGWEVNFWAKVQKTGACWLWIAGKDYGGYGSFQHKRAHRLSYEMHVGPIPKGMFVCHSCDVPACINPAHLFLGTARDNVRDMIAKGRLPSRVLGTTGPCGNCSAIIPQRLNSAPLWCLRCKRNSCGYCNVLLGASSRRNGATRCQSCTRKGRPPLVPPPKLGDRDGELSRTKTHCPKGHAYDAKNTRITTKGYRMCRRCAIIRCKPKT